jgi:hypothetical protein
MVLCLQNDFVDALRAAKDFTKRISQSLGVESSKPALLLCSDACSF